MKLSKRIFSKGLAVIGLSYAAAAGLWAHPALAQDKPVLVFAAASLRNAMGDVINAFTARSGQKVVAAYAGSNALARQIENGAPADIFVSADAAWMDHLTGRGLVRREDTVTLLRNRLVMIAPAGHPTPLDLTKSGELMRRLGAGRLAMAETSGVPAGRYGKAALEKLVLWAGVNKRLAQADNVRAALMFVARGEAPLGIVYVSDAASEPKVVIVAEFPPDAHPPILYPAAMTAGGKNPQARTFFRFLTGPEARPFFGKHGFAAPGKSGS